mmetsp:Transcript_87981/g.244171  ORF Transcript_87981/g.244171 Transcript_87981/m.244171 type:complete len:266 (+) Transcript_87981:589-1386(+)
MVREVLLVLVHGVGIEEDRGALRDLVALEFHVDLGLAQGELGRDVAVQPHRLRDARVRQAEVQQVVQPQRPDRGTLPLLGKLLPDLGAHALEDLRVRVHVGHQPADGDQLVPVRRELQREHKLLEALQHVVVRPPLGKREELLEQRVLPLVLLGILEPILVAPREHGAQVLPGSPDLGGEEPLLVDAVDGSAHDVPRVLALSVEHVGIGLHDVSPQRLEDILLRLELCLHPVTEVLSGVDEDLRSTLQRNLVGEEVRGRLVEDLP